MNYLFMYGTLKPGGRAFPRIEKEVENPREGSVAGRLFNVNDAFPALRQEPEDLDFEVFGTLLDVKPDTDYDMLLRRLDFYEGAPNLYTRKVGGVLVGSRIYDATFYVGNDPQLFENDIIPSGRWTV